MTFLGTRLPNIKKKQECGNVSPERPRLVPVEVQALRVSVLKVQALFQWYKPKLEATKATEAQRGSPTAAMPNESHSSDVQGRRRHSPGTYPTRTKTGLDRFEWPWRTVAMHNPKRQATIAAEPARRL